MFRKYFIEVEKRYKKIQTPKLPQNYLEALKELVRVEEERQALEAENRQMKPKAEAFDELISTDGKYTMSEVAKLLNWGRNRLFKFLRMQGILRNNNEPYQEYVDRGYFKLRTYTIKHTDFEEVKVQTLVTPKGLEWIRKILKREMEFI
nr:phage antirepressor KilAC domain-containing protein [Marinitoga sp. 1135]